MLGRLFGVLSALAFAGLIAAQIRGAAPGQFDYYLFSLSWAPEFCAQSGAAAANPQECAAGKNIGFVVHGLWPEAAQGRSPESCGPGKRVSGAIVNSMLPSMLSRGLIQHEWDTHGTCTGLTAAAYFTDVMVARAAVQIPVQISSIGQTTKESRGQIEEQFAATNRSFPAGGFRVACRSGAMTEVRACFDKNLKPRVCTASAGECPMAIVTVLQSR